MRPTGQKMPDVQIAWMKEHGLLAGSEAGTVPPTQETTNCLSFLWRSALRDPHEERCTASGTREGFRRRVVICPAGRILFSVALANDAVQRNPRPDGPDV